MSDMSEFTEVSVVLQEVWGSVELSLVLAETLAHVPDAAAESLEGSPCLQHKTIIQWLIC